MMNRSVIVLTVLLSLLTAGCLGGSAGSEPSAFSPTPIPPTTLEPSQEIPTQVPEPITAALWASGLAVAVAFRRKAARP